MGLNTCRINPLIADTSNLLFYFIQTKGKYFYNLSVLQAIYDAWFLEMINIFVF